MSTGVQQGNHVNQKHSFEQLPIGKVFESKQNPRRHFDEAKLRELADNIGQVGILSPLIVRPITAGIYEIAAGHRRYRAAKLASLAFVPCLVREMTDQEFMELLNIENLQREGLHPLDEAKGYEVLMAAPYRMNVERIAEKVGRSVKYVYDRVKLLGLIPPLQKLFWQDKFSAGHAILLARLSKDEQLRCLGSEDDCYLDGGLFEAQHTLYREDAQEDVDEFKVRSVVELNAWIDKHVRFDRTKVDPMLFPATAQAIEQVQQQDPGHVDIKRVVVPITYEHFAAPDVKDERDRTLSVVSWKRADGKQGSKSCDHAVLVCVVFGPGRGETFEVCINKKTCLIHWKERIKAAEKSKKSTTISKTSVPKKPSWQIEQEREQARVVPPAFVLGDGGEGSDVLRSSAVGVELTNDDPESSLTQGGATQCRQAPLITNYRSTVFLTGSALRSSHLPWYRKGDGLSADPFPSHPKPKIRPADSHTKSWLTPGWRTHFAGGVMRHSQRVPFDGELARLVEDTVGHPLFARPKPTSTWECRQCGCTDDRACPGGCYWVGPNLCSRCV